MTVPPWEDDRWSKMPIVRNNYSLFCSFRARDRVLKALAEGPFDALFYNTQTIALFGLPLMRRFPTIISADATPINMDTVAAGYDHRPASGTPLDYAKFVWQRRVFRRATALVAHSEWVKQSMILSYGVRPERVSVIPLGIEVKDWAMPTRVPSNFASRPARLLFVGGQFERKGGRILLEAFTNGLSKRCELDIVTRDQFVDADESVRVHRGVNAGSSEIKQLFAKADIFVFPTLGDCSPQVVIEAMASGLPVISTEVGAIGEEVEDGVTGILVPPGDADALARAVNVLLDDPALLVAYGAAGRRAAERLFDADRNYRKVFDVIKRSIDEFPGEGTRHGRHGTH
jgi:glycosyltransferase involved in cell wall biosynthesis